MKIWVPDKPKIDRYGCTCSCFDTVFRGGLLFKDNSFNYKIYFLIFFGVLL